MKQSVSEQIVNDIINQVEQNNILPWECEWVSHGIPYNFITGKRYRGFNILALWVNAQKNGYSDKGYCSFLQAKEKGGNVKQGEHGTGIIYFNFKEIETEKNGEKKIEQIPYTKRYTVFNRSQCENLKEEDTKQNNTFESAEKIISALNLTTEYGDPAYCRTTDIISITSISDFKNSEAYYHALFHEVVHWSGAPDRLKRVKGESFGDEKYSFEELIAEIGSVFLCAECGLHIETKNNAAYVKSWLEVLKSDKTLIVKAASKAQEAVDYILKLATGEPAGEIVRAAAEQPAAA